ncbi:hypothetical protein HYH02_001517 [Chlamydomonas schloesseri]|uniref:Plastocyanin-like domain-containing protein n=1 Tax=Chlamydomonas schloesseri TaxID=2026947 RepID=A0A836BBV9_9CHLO|nr:hypothetical protein HYH02_001517 [Chlamydomonas schloesseri]|eukprot:KAG2453290.1 hypothetical protein HYH02_001517 [Chlamydomonas schloesseri]
MPPRELLAAAASALLLLLCALPPGRAAVSIPIPIRPPRLPSVPTVRLRSGAVGGSVVDISVEPAELQLSLGAAAGNGTNTSLSFTTPRYLSSRAASADKLQPPALVLDAICNTFGVRLTNNLPFQGVSTCPNAPGTNGAPQFENGPHDLEWTNLHTHGLKVDPGAVSLNNTCQPGNPEAGFPPGANTDLSLYYCSPNVSSSQLCQVYGDNVLVNGRPLASAPVTPYAMPGLAPGGATLSYTYPLGAIVPGMGWYHPHTHGSVGIQTPTAAAPFIVPESWLQGGVTSLYDAVDPTGRGGPPVPAGECDRLVGVLAAQPLETATILQINGLWFRKKADGTDDDDSLPFLGKAPGGTQVSPLLYDVLANGTASPKFNNAAGRDWALVNGAFQPTISLTEGLYTRWEILNTMTMKWLDLTIQRVLPNGAFEPADCGLWLLGRDGVPLPLVPRRLVSLPADAVRAQSDLILGPANRADLLVKCNTAGTYVLASGAGPFHTNYTACTATHCELFGDVPPPSFGVPRSANNLYGGLELSGAVLAVVQVVRRGANPLAQPDFSDEVCRSRLELFPYLDYLSFPEPAVSQCFSFMNQQGGGFCSINSQLFPTATAYVEQGTQQVWTLRDITFHPFHLHETPVRITSLPTCATSVTNNWAVGDWLDSVHLPVCQNGCQWLDAGSGGGQCGSDVEICDEVTVQWLATMFNMPASRGSSDLCAGRGTAGAGTGGGCVARYSVFHCHILPHEDEGCIWPVKWFCPNDTVAYPKAECPKAYPPCPSAGAAAAVLPDKTVRRSLRGVSSL